MTGDDENPECVVWDWQQCRCRIEDADFDRVVGIEITGIYDGVLFWRCYACGRSFQRWPEDHGLHAKAQSFIDAWNWADERFARFVRPGLFTSRFAHFKDFADGGDEEHGETLGDALKRLAYEELPPDDEDEDAEDGGDEP